MPSKRVSTRTDQIFFQGVLAALAQVKDVNTVLYDEIVSACGGKLLVEEARRSGQMRISGIGDYLRRNSQPESKEESRLAQPGGMG